MDDSRPLQLSCAGGSFHPGESCRAMLQAFKNGIYLFSRLLLSVNGTNSHGFSQPKTWVTLTFSLTSTADIWPTTKPYTFCLPDTFFAWLFPLVAVLVQAWCAAIISKLVCLAPGFYPLLPTVLYSASSAIFLKWKFNHLTCLLAILQSVLLDLKTEPN